VIDSGKTSLRDLYTKEDWMAVWMGFVLLIVGLLIYLPNPPEKAAEIPKYNTVMKEEAAKAPFKTIEWHNASSAKRGVRATNQDFAKTIQKFLSAPSDWSTNPLDALIRTEETAKAMGAPFKEAADKAKAAAEAAIAKAKAAQTAAAAAGFKDANLNAAADKDIKAWQEAKDKASKADGKVNVKAYNRIPYLIGLCIIWRSFGVCSHRGLLRQIRGGSRPCQLSPCFGLSLLLKYWGLVPVAHRHGQPSTRWHPK
jgi:hypothetical protein